MRIKILKVFAVVLVSFFIVSNVTAGESSNPLPPDTLTLREAFRLALKRSEDIAISHEQIELAQAHVYQALSEILPSVDFVMTRQDQDAPSSVAGDVTGSLRRSTPQNRFKFTQPIFTGFKAIAAIRGSGAERAQKRFEKKRAEELLFIDVMDSFYLVLQSRRDVRILSVTQKTLNERIHDLNERVQLGRSRESEVSSATADLKTVEANLWGAKRSQVLAEQLLEYYIGCSVKGQIVEDWEQHAKTLDEYLATVLKRSDVQAAENALVVAQQGVVVAQSDLFPKVDVSGNYYTRRVGIASGVDWDVLLTCTVPIFEGMQTVGNIKEAVSYRHVQEQTVSKTRRLAELDVRNSYETFVFSREEESAYLAAAQAALKNYRLLTNEYKLNLVNNLDVLDALRRHQDVYRAYNEAHYAAKQNYWKLKISAGENLF